MHCRLVVLSLCLTLASAVGAETVYKYRRADGQVTYSNRPIAGLELIETFEYRFVAPAPGNGDAARSAAAKSDAEGEARIRKYLDSLQAAWSEVQEAGKALAAAEERARAGVELQPGDREGVASGAAPPAAGGVPGTAAPAVGGSQSGRRGRPSPEYVARMQGLEEDVRSARARLDVALRRYNQLR